MGNAVLIPCRIPLTYGTETPKLDSAGVHLRDCVSEGRTPPIQVPEMLVRSLLGAEDPSRKALSLVSEVSPSAFERGSAALII
jgi:hypothetical protein